MKVIIVSAKARFVPDIDCDFEVISSRNGNILAKSYGEGDTKEYVFVFQCISDESTRRENKEQYISSFISDIIKYLINTENPQAENQDYYLILHDGDLLRYGEGMNGVYHQGANFLRECHLTGGHIYLFQHERPGRGAINMYSILISNLRNLDETMINEALNLFNE